MVWWIWCLWKLLVYGLAVIVAVVIFFAGVLVRVGIVSIGGPLDPSGPHSFCDLWSWRWFSKGSGRSR